MPTVPRYDAPQVAQQATPTPTLLAPEMPNVAAKQGQQLGQAIQGAGQTISKIEIEALDQANRARVLDARNKLTDYKQALTFGREGVDEGFSNIKGNNALERERSLDVEYDEKYGKKYDEVLSALSNDAQKAAFQQWADSDRTSFRGSIGQHIGRESYAYQIDVLKSANEIAKNNIALQWDNPDVVLGELENIRATTSELAKKQGLTGIPQEAMMAESLSPAHLTVITQAVDGGNSSYAREYLAIAKEGNELTDEALLRAEKLIEAGDFTERTQAYADEYMTASGYDLDAAISTAKKNLVGKERDEVVRRIKNEKADRNAAKAADMEAANQEGYSAYVSGGFDAIPLAVRNRMDQRTLASLKARDEKQRNGTLKSDREVVGALYTMMSKDPEAFSNYDMGPLSQYLDDGDYDKFLGMQARIRAKDEDGKQIIATTSLISSAAKGLKGEKDGAFRLIAAEELQRAQDLKGSKLTLEEQTALLRSLRIKGEYADEGIFERDVERYQAISEGREFVPNE